MIKRLVRKLLRGQDSTSDPALRNAGGKWSGAIGIGCNAALFLGKLAVGLLSGSVSILADAVNNLSDASSSLISLLGFKLAGRPADAEHPYGHGRYEYLSGLTVSVLILLIGVELFRESLGKALHPSPVDFHWTTAVVLLCSVAVKLWMMRFNRAMGKAISSQTLLATAADSRNDVISTLAVLAAALLSHVTPLELDGWIGIAVAAFILYSGFGLIRDTLDPLLGKAPDRELVRQIQAKILSYPGVLGTHDLLLHDYGPGRQFASVHVEMAAEENVLESHDVIDNIERDFLSDLGLHLIIHFDPIVTAEGAVEDLRQWLSGAVQELYPGLTIHDLRTVPGPTHTKVIFDCVVPRGCPLQDGALKAAVSKLVADHHPGYICVITLDESFASLPHES